MLSVQVAYYDPQLVFIVKRQLAAVIPTAAEEDVRRCSIPRPHQEGQLLLWAL